MASRDVRMVTARTSVNIAVIKYWGKRDETLIIPINDSISGTLDSEDLCTTTTIAISPFFNSDRMWLNGKEVTIEENKRLVQCLTTMRSKVPSVTGGLRISSYNNFPTAAGLASSAAGYACLVYALGNLFGITDKEELSVMARMGSGSAIRSLEGGFVQWIAGNSSETSIARQIVPDNHWPEMKVLILVVDDHQKETGSTDGMKRSAETSDLIDYRATVVVPKRIERMKKAIIDRDFESFAEITMKDSNQFHAIAQDTFPPIRYMIDVSWKIVSFVHGFNKIWGSVVAAYTFDAGPNACIYILDHAIPTFLFYMTATRQFDEVNMERRCQNQGLEKIRMKNQARKQQLLQDITEVSGVETVRAGLGCPGIIPLAPLLKYIICTGIGKGAEVLPDGPHLLDQEGNPVPFHVQSVTD